jgi:hypothetical protein
MEEILQLGRLNLRLRNDVDVQVAKLNGWLGVHRPDRCLASGHLYLQKLEPPAGIEPATY